MYKRLLMLAIGMLAAVSVARANDILRITETGEGFSDLVATFNGSPLKIILSGGADGWTVQLPSGYKFERERVGAGIFLSEPENSALFDQINIAAPKFLTWISDIPISGATGTGQFTFLDAGTGPGHRDFDLVVVAGGGASNVPDSGSTVMLFAGGLLVTGLLSRRQWLQ